VWAAQGMREGGTWAQGGCATHAGEEGERWAARGRDSDDAGALAQLGDRPDELLHRVDVVVADEPGRGRGGSEGSKEWIQRCLYS